jgi:predicted double-glycine peptidase
MRWNVPYYKQTTDSTCGSACVMMILKFFNPKIKLSRKFEFEIWREASILFTGATSSFGIAKSIAKRGIKVTIHQKKRKLGYYRIKGQKKKNLIFIERLMKKEAIESGVKIKYGRFDIDLIKKLIKDGPIIILINLKPITREDINHWVVLTGIDDQFVYVNDPWVSKKSKFKRKKDFPIKIKIFEKAMHVDNKEYYKMWTHPTLIYFSK